MTGIQLLKKSAFQRDCHAGHNGLWKSADEGVEAAPEFAVGGSTGQTGSQPHVITGCKKYPACAETFARRAPQNDMREKPIPQVAEPPSTAETPRKNFLKRILVVDDEPLICRLYSELLVDSGYEVDTAEDGAIAWDELQRNGYDLLVKRGLPHLLR